VGLQLINFSSLADPDATYSHYTWATAQGHQDTIKKMAARRGQPELADIILRLNLGRDVLPHSRPKPHQRRPPTPKLKSTTHYLRPGARIKLPGTMRPGFYFSVLAGDKPPVIKKAYAEFDVVAVPGRVGINRFLGYPPIEMDIDIQFSSATDMGGSHAGAYHGRASIEQRITTLERMAGRGRFQGSGFGPPAVIVVSTTNDAGDIVPLIPFAYQWTPQHPNAPAFRITAIAWDDADVMRNESGFRTRQKATITLTEYTPLRFIHRSTAVRFQMSVPKGDHFPGKKKAAPK